MLGWLTQLTRPARRTAAARQFETWFSENVKPNVPGVQHEIIDLQAVVQP